MSLYFQGISIDILLCVIAIKIKFYDTEFYDTEVEYAF